MFLPTGMFTWVISIYSPPELLDRWVGQVPTAASRCAALRACRLARTFGGTWLAGTTLTPGIAATRGAGTCGATAMATPAAAVLADVSVAVVAPAGVAVAAAAGVAVPDPSSGTLTPI